MDDKWKRRFFSLAKEVSTWSKDPSTKIGAIVVDDDKRVLTQAYNGLSRGIEDSLERLTNRELKYELINHAEMNCIFNACSNGVSLKNGSMYVYGLPICVNCAKGIIQVGIKEVNILSKFYTERWEDSWGKAKMLFEEADVKIEISDMDI